MPKKIKKLKLKGLFKGLKINEKEIEQAKNFGDPKKQYDLNDFIGMLTDEEAKKLKQSIKEWRKGQSEECQHDWVFIPTTSTYKWAGYWRCNKCGLFRF